VTGPLIGVVMCFSLPAFFLYIIFFYQ